MERRVRVRSARCSMDVRVKQAKRNGESSEEQQVSSMPVGLTRHLSRKERYKRLVEVVDPDDRVGIIISPDPDSIAGAMALRRLLWRKVKSVAVFCSKPIQRVDNLTMIRTLSVTLLPLQEIKKYEITRFAMVDSQPHHDDQFKRFAFSIIIDHHPPGNAAKAAFVDIRPEYGATSSMLTEYLRAARITPSARLATALFYGIKTDTNNFVREATEQDMTAFRYLFRFANMNVVKKIEASEITKKTLSYYQKGMEKLKFWKSIAYAHLGSVGNPDACVQMADFFLKLSEASWSIVSGVYGGTLVVIFRNDGYRKNAGKTAQRLFGQLGKAGGHKAAARAEVAIKDLKPHLKPKDEIETFVFRLVKRIAPRTPASQTPLAGCKQEPSQVCS